MISVRLHLPLPAPVVELRRFVDLAERAGCDPITPHDGGLLAATADPVTDPVHPAAEAAAESAAAPTPQSSTGDGDGEAQADGAGVVTLAGGCSGSPADPALDQGEAASPVEDPGRPLTDADAGLNEYPCPHCDFVATSNAGRAAHVRSHEAKVPCEACGHLIHPSGRTLHGRKCPGAPTTAATPEPSAPPRTHAAARPRPAAPAARPPRADRPTKPVVVGKSRGDLVTPKPKRQPRPAGEGEEEYRPGPPLAGRASWTCGFLYGPGVTCGAAKETGDRGWRRARLDGQTGHVDLCPAHADATDHEVRQALDAQGATS